MFFLVVVDVRGGAVRVLPVGDFEQRARRYRSTRVVPGGGRVDVLRVAAIMGGIPTGRPIARQIVWGARSRLYGLTCG
ncbi:hypothetical protein [Saccharothrix sp. Mg75]|uniref:hypothetical protein n=1 Tax=Saccharothrix sp. Mg75 TaxID=3445357 RepID=UPI003EEBD749